MMTDLPASFVIHSFATLAALQCEDHIGGVENSEPAVEAGRRIEVAGAERETCGGEGGWSLVGARESGG